jgi:small subunit ribosomal protein S3
LGQKVHPLGFRLVTIQKIRSTWFSEFKNYPELICEDAAIRTFIQNKTKQSAISKIEIKRNSTCNKIEVTIFTARPGIFVGEGGSNLKFIYDNLKKLIKPQRKIILNIFEVKNPDAKAPLIGDFIVDLLERRIPFRKAIKKAISRTQAAKILGVKIEVSGRLNGAEMARSEWIREGRVPLQTLRADIDYAEKRANTIYGVMGIKIWLFNGEVI